MRLAGAVAWVVAWGLFGLPWDGSAPELNRRGMLWTVLPPTNHHLLDAALNLAFYAPLGVLLRSLDVTLLQSLALGCALSVITEVLQLFSPTRVPTLADVVFNTAGVALGFGVTGWVSARQRA